MENKILISIEVKVLKNKVSYNGVCMPTRYLPKTNVE